MIKICIICNILEKELKLPKDTTLVMKAMNFPIKMIKMKPKKFLTNNNNKLFSINKENKDLPLKWKNINNKIISIIIIITLEIIIIIIIKVILIIILIIVMPQKQLKYLYKTKNKKIKDL